MLRTILILLLAVIGISLLRTVIGVVTKVLGALFSGSESPAHRDPASASPSSVPTTGTLRKCPVCATYAPQRTGLELHTGAGQTLHFCSEDCKQKYAKSSAAS